MQQSLAVRSFQGKSENMVSDKGNKIQAPDDFHISINIRNEYATYHNDLIRILDPFKLKWDGQLDHKATATHRIQ